VQQREPPIARFRINRVRFRPVVAGLVAPRRTVAVVGLPGGAVRPILTEIGLAANDLHA